MFELEFIFDLLVRCSTVLTRIGVIISDEPRINEEIRVSQVRLIGPKGEQVGVIATSVALNLAKEANLDLVEVAPTAKPPTVSTSTTRRLRLVKRVVIKVRPRLRKFVSDSRLTTTISTLRRVMFFDS